MAQVLGLDPDSRSTPQHFNLSTHVQQAIFRQFQQFFLQFNRPTVDQTSLTDSTIWSDHLAALASKCGAGVSRYFELLFPWFGTFFRHEPGTLETFFTKALLNFPFSGRSESTTWHGFMSWIMGRLNTTSGLEASWEKARNVDSRSSLFVELAVSGPFSSTHLRWAVWVSWLRQSL